MRGKHASDEGFELDIPWKKIFIFIIILGIAVGVFFGGKKVYPIIASKDWFKSNKTEKTEIVTATPKEDKMPTTVDGFNVLGEVKFDKLKYTGYVLDSELNKTSSTNITATTNVNSDTTDELVDIATDSVEDTDVVSSNTSQTNVTDLNKALEKGLVKLYGDKLNVKGNFAIIGHNKEKFFDILQGVSIGDSFSIKANTNIEKKYIVYEVKTIEPDDLTCLMPNNEYIEVTLITCSTGSNKRLVVKALEEKDYEKYKKKLAENQVEQTEETNESTSVGE